MSSGSRVQEWVASVPFVTVFLFGLNISVHVYIFLASSEINQLSINPARVIYKEEVYNFQFSDKCHQFLSITEYCRLHSFTMESFIF